jgi:hypothetical protein
VVEVRLFGNLRRYVAGARPTTDTVLQLPVDEAKTVGQVFARVGIDPAEVGQVFINGRLLPRSSYPITLGYLLAAEGPLTPEKYLGTPVRAGDRVGIFPRNMGAVVV